MLLTKIKQFLKEQSIEELHIQTGISTSVFYSLLKKENKKYSKNTFDILYGFFNLEKDEFYMENVKKWHPKTPSLFGTFVRLKRLEQNMHLKDLAKKTKVDQRALARLESGDALPTFQGWTIQHLMDALNFTKEERHWTQQYIQIMKHFEKSVKKYDIK